MARSPLQYLGVTAINPPDVIRTDRPPTSADIAFPFNTLWVDIDTNIVYMLTTIAAGSATWALLGPGNSEVDTLSGDSGGNRPATAGNIVIAGGTNIATAGAASTITVNLDAAITLATSVTSPIYTSAAGMAINAAAGQNIVIKMGDAAGANKVSFVDSGSVEVAAIDSNGAFTTGAITFTGLLTAAASAVIDTAGTDLDLGTDNSGDAINIGLGNVIRAIHIGDSSVAHTVNIGSSSAGVVDIQSNFASQFAVTGAGIDLTLASAAGRVVVNGEEAAADAVRILSAAGGMDVNTALQINIDSSQAAADAIVLDASGAAGGIKIRGGTGGIAVGDQADTSPIGVGDIAPTASRTITIGGGTVVTASVTDTIDIGPDGATTNGDSVKTVNINTGGVTTGQVLTNIASGAVTSGTHTTSIASGNRAAGTMALNIMTGTGTKIANLGNADAGTTFNIDAVTLINDSINANVSILTGTSTGVLAVGNSLAGAMTIDSGAGISIDMATASNFTVTGAGQDLTLASVGGSVLVSSTEDAALAIRLYANGGTSETIQLHSDQGTGVGSVNLLSDVGGITFRATGLASADAINLEAVAGGIDMDAALQISMISSQASATAVVIQASDAAGGVAITSGTGNIVQSSTGTVLIDSAGVLELNSSAGVISIGNDAVSQNMNIGTAGARTITIGNGTGATSVVISSGTGAINVGTNGVAHTVTVGSTTGAAATVVQAGTGGIAINASGLVNVDAVVDTQGTPTAASTINARVGAATFTGFTTAAAGTQDFTITNSLVTTSSNILCTVCNEGANDAQMNIRRITRAAGSFVVKVVNSGAAALNGNVIITFWVLDN